MATSSSLQDPRSCRLHEQGVTSHHKYLKHAGKPPERGQFRGGRRRGEKRKERVRGENGAQPSALNRWVAKCDRSARRDNDHVGTATHSATLKVVKPQRPKKKNATADQVTSMLYVPDTRQGRSDRKGNSQISQKSSPDATRRRNKNATPTLVVTMLRRPDLADDVELPASSDESVEALSLSKENEVEEVDPQQPEIQLGDSDEEEYTSDQNESDNEDVNAEFDMSPTSEDIMENDLLYDMFMRNHRFTEHSDELHARSAWTTIESYNRGMDERYGDDSQHPELDLDI
ncbi:hypothetical protein Taro_000492 [Colocasia esculenta]|uniref:Uncharacterized protein n=1 Tax=Colocasia esculenta TaxID=4460 RepID=A0A843TD65_COLES|nr:hypothetical protein [Colocasia esculenta]